MKVSFEDVFLFNVPLGSSGFSRFFLEILFTFEAFKCSLLVVVVSSFLPGFRDLLLGRFCDENSFTSWPKLLHLLGVFLGGLILARGVLGAGSKILVACWGIFFFCLRDFLLLIAKPLCFNNTNEFATFTNSCCL